MIDGAEHALNIVLIDAHYPPSMETVYKFAVSKRSCGCYVYPYHGIGGKAARLQKNPGDILDKLCPYWKIPPAKGGVRHVVSDVNRLEGLPLRTVDDRDGGPGLPVSVRE